MRTPKRSVVVKTALISRLTVLVLQYLSNVLIPDHNAGVFTYPKEILTESSADKLVQHFLSGLTRWDAQYFIHIAKYGYTYENTVAFFPLFPVLANLVAKFVPEGILNIDSILMIIFTVLNVIFFIYSAVALYELSMKLFHEKFAFVATVLFCWNPASVFFSAFYTECLFSLLSFKSMLNCIILYEKYCNLNLRIVAYDILYLVPISLSGVTRSNGVLNTGFFLYFVACIFMRGFRQIKGTAFVRLAKKFSLILAFGIITFFGVVFCLILFDLYQIYCYKLFCKDFESSNTLPDFIKQFSVENNFVLMGTFSKNRPSWCLSKFPLAYSYVQKKYWNVGFLSYYEVKQIPNFMLAAPILVIFVVNCVDYLRRNYTSFLDLFNFDHSLKYGGNLIFDNQNLAVFIIHGLVLASFCVFFVHIQVSTRLLCSASPLLYWISAYFLMENGKFCDIRQFRTFTFERKFLILYYFTYFTIGIGLFSNFLPWT